MKQTQIETAQPRLCWSRTVDEAAEHRSGWGQAVVGRVAQFPHLLMLC